MITLRDGPAAGSYAVKRAPLYLRAVVDRSRARDVLDQLDDTPRGTERVHIYQRVGEAGALHLNRGRHGSGFYALGTYRHLPEVEGDELRETTAWRQWVGAQEGDGG